MDREAWHVAVHGIAKSWTRLSDWTEVKAYDRWKGDLNRHESVSISFFRAQKFDFNYFTNNYERIKNIYKEILSLTLSFLKQKTKLLYI